jgi:hypothetical protein
MNRLEAKIKAGKGKRRGRQTGTEKCWYLALNADTGKIFCFSL